MEIDGGGSIKVPSLGVRHRRIILNLIQAGVQIMIIVTGIEANFDTKPLIQAMEICLYDNHLVLLKLKGNSFELFTALDFHRYGVHLPPLHVLNLLECKLESCLSQREDMDDSDSEAYAFVDEIHIKQNGLIEITGIAVENQIDVGIKWAVIDSVKVKSGSEKDVSEVSQGSLGSSSVKSESSTLVICSPLKMLRFIGEKAQISYTGGISAFVGVVPSLLQTAGSKATTTITTASVDCVRMVALGLGCFFATLSWMLMLSKSKKDLGTISAACSFFSMIIGLFCTIFSQIPGNYRACVITVFMLFLLLVAFYASEDQDIETTSKSTADPDPKPLRCKRPEV